MTIEALKNSKDLKIAGKKLGRAGISERALQIAKEIVEDGSYKRAVKGVGQMKALAMACAFDDYWQEKRDDGFYEETYNLVKP